MALFALLFCMAFLAVLRDVVPANIRISELAPHVPVALLVRDAQLRVLVMGEDGLPRPGATIRVFAMIGDKAYFAGEATADAGGQAVFADLPRGEAWVVAYEGNRSRASTRVALDTGLREAHLTLSQARALDVIVVDGNDAPVEGADIVVGSEDPLPFLGRTGADGKARIDRLGPSPYVVRVSADGYDDVVRTGVTPVGPLRIKLERLASLLVTVIGLDGAPAPFADVYVAGTSVWPPRRTQTNDAGRVRIAGLAGGAYDLKARLGAAVSETTSGLLLKRGEDQEVDLLLTPGRYVTVHVVDGDAEDAPSIQGASVLLAEHGLSSFPLLGKTNEKGLVQLGPIGDDKASVSARAAGYVQTSAVPVGILDDEVTVPLLRGATIVGEVVDDRGYPIAGATIEVVGVDRSGMPIDETYALTEFREGQFERMLPGPMPLIPMGELGVMPGPIPDLPHDTRGLSAPAATATPSDDAWVTRKDGAFRATPVTPGRVQAIARHPSFVDAMSEEISLAPGGEAHVRIVMRMGGLLEGRVVEDDRTPVASARVELTSLVSTVTRVTFTAQDGTFAFAAAPSEVLLSVARADAPADVVAKVLVDVEDRGRKEVEIVLPKALEPVRVRVTDDRGYPLGRVEIHALSLDLGYAVRKTVFSDDDGGAVVPGARGLPLRFTLSRTGHAPLVQDVESAPAEVTFSLSRGVEAFGRVTGRDGRDWLEGAEILVHTATGMRRATSDVEGSFRLTDLAPGRVRLAVSQEGYASVEELAVVGNDPDRPTDLGDIDLAEAGEVSGVVVDEEDKPVAGVRVAQDAVPTYLPLGPLPPGIVLTDREGRFTIAGLAEGDVTLAAYSRDAGRGTSEPIPVRAGRTTSRVKITIVADEEPKKEAKGAGSVAITLGEKNTDRGRDVLVMLVAPGSEAEVSGLLAGDQLLEVDGRKVKSIEDARRKMTGPLAEDVLFLVERSFGPISRGVASPAQDPIQTLLRIRREKVRK